jgi:membrane fusion protein, cation efflux system
VQYKDFYEPVPVKTGSTKGDLIEITEGLSIGEKLVTRGSLTLYAESRKTKPTNTASSLAKTDTQTDAAKSNTDPAHAKAHAEGKPHSHSTESNFPIMQSAIAGGGVLIVAAGTIAFLANRNKRKKNSFSGRKGDF